MVVAIQIGTANSEFAAHVLTVKLVTFKNDDVVFLYVCYLPTDSILWIYFQNST